METSLKWTKEKPTTPGWYWEYNEGYIRCLQVYSWNGRRSNDGGKGLWCSIGPVILSIADWPETKWSGPIPPPTE